MRNFIHILRVLLGLVFIYSGMAKLYPAEPFELFIFDRGIFDFTLSVILVRLIIGTEIALGVVLLINIFTKIFIRLTVLLLIIFTGFLIYMAIFKTETENCNCFGEYFALTTVESIIKNLILIGLSIFIILKNKEFTFRFRRIVLPVACALSFTIPFILNPPDPFVVNLPEYPSGYAFDEQAIGDLTNNESTVRIDKEKYIICFFSLKCKFCKLAAQKLAIISRGNDLENSIYYVFIGEEKDLQQFWKESKSPVIPYRIMEPKQFFSLAGMSLPSILFIRKGIVEKTVGYRNLLDTEVVNFISENN
ncbi:MAG: DoxX family protein [Bacteroidetes bacterium]|nr:DoxX family protein [Bacteroidota bacterium]